MAERQSHFVEWSVGEAFDRASTLLLLQQTLIEELTAENARLRLERDEARAIRNRLDLLNDRLAVCQLTR